MLVVDRLVNPKVLEYARRDAERIFVGKTPGGPTTTQAEINRILVREAPAGKVVARLKGGDPFIFGRAAEEMAALQAAGIEVEVVPGMTAGARLRRAHWPARNAARARAPVLGRDRRDCRGRAGSRLAGARRRIARHSQSTWASATRPLLRGNLLAAGADPTTRRDRRERHAGERARLSPPRSAISPTASPARQSPAPPSSSSASTGPTPGFVRPRVRHPVHRRRAAACSERFDDRHSPPTQRPRHEQDHRNLAC